MEPLDTEQIAAWIEAARAGDDQALSRLIGAAMEFLFPAALGMLRDRHRQGAYLTDAISAGGADLLERMKDDAWEITHAACCRVALKLNTFRGRDLLGREVKFSTWLYAIARNEVRNLLRSRFREAKRRWQSRPPEDEGEESPYDPFDLAEEVARAPGPEQVAEENDERRILLQALKEAPLTPEQREAVLLYYGCGIKQERIAQLTGVQVGTVKKRLFDALGKLRAYVKERSGEPAKREGRA